MNLTKELIEQYITASKTRGLSDHTIRAYNGDLKSLLKWQDHTISEQTKLRDLVQDWLNWQASEEKSTRTRKRRIASIKAYSKWLASQGYETEDLDSLPKFKLSKILPRNLSRSELSQLFKGHIDKNVGYKELLSRTIVEVLFQTGMRVGELCKLKITDYDPILRSFRVMGKGMRERNVYLVAEEVVQMVESYIATRGGVIDESFFVDKNGRGVYEDGVRRLVATFSKKRGINRKVTPHMLRHSAATELLSCGADMRSVQKLLGHSSLAITEIYTHISDEGLIATLKKSNPRRILT